jgi:tRNA (cytidine/uridine-2'-O-)-methyltransferase
MAFPRPCNGGVGPAAVKAAAARPCFDPLPMRLALFEPDIPQNAGTLIRLAACLDVGIDIIEPCGFVISDRMLRRAALDYLFAAQVTRHDSWTAFHAACRAEERLILLTTHGDLRYDHFAFSPDDILILGRESAGATEAVHQSSAARLRIPMRSGMRSLNVAIAGAIVLAEALRQTGLLPER